MSSTPILGIDLGTTNSAVGIVEAGFPLVLADTDQKRTTPSTVFFPVDKDELPLVGRAAERAGSTNPERCIRSTKRLIGRSYSSLSLADHEAFPQKLAKGPDDEVLILLDDATHTTAEEVATLILRHMHTLAALALEVAENELTRVVITVPAYFNNNQRAATKRAAEAAGLAVERMINEPTAAALAYGLESLSDDHHVAVYDLGGGTFDLSILRMKGDFFEVIATAGDTQLGGDDLDNAIAEHLCREWNLDSSSLSVTQQSQLRSAARQAKERLAQESESPIRLPFFRDQESFSYDLQRDTLEKIADPFLTKTHTLCRQAIAEAEQKGLSKINHVLLVGGSTKLPLLRTRAAEWFGLDPDLSQNPDEAIALGAGIQGGILSGSVRDVVLVDVTPLSLGIETYGGLMNVLIPRNSTIPVKAGEMFTNAVANQSHTVIRVLQGEREMAKDNWQLGEVRVPLPAAPKGQARVGVQFSIDRNGMLEVLARDVAAYERDEAESDHILMLESTAVDVADEKVEKMVSESIDYAFDDMNERIWTEAAHKADELLPAVEEALKGFATLLSDDEINTIRAAAADVSSIRQAKTHDANALKQANQKLDQATEALAAKVVDAAMDEAFG